MGIREYNPAIIPSGLFLYSLPISSFQITLRLEIQMEHDMEIRGPCKGCGLHRAITPIMENQMETMMENDMESRIRYFRLD